MRKIIIWVLMLGMVFPLFGGMSNAIWATPFQLIGMVYEPDGVSPMATETAASFEMMICIDEDGDGLYWPGDATDAVHTYSDSGMNGYAAINEDFIFIGIYMLDMLVGQPGGFNMNFKIWVNGTNLNLPGVPDGYCVDHADGVTEVFTFPSSGDAFTQDVNLPTNPIPLYSIENIDTNETFPSIQEAIDDPDTLNGHTIQLGGGIYYDPIIIDKEITLIGQGKNFTIIDGNYTHIVVDIVANNVTLSNLNVREGEFGVNVRYVSGVRLNDLCVEYCNPLPGTNGINILESNDTWVENCWLSNNNYGFRTTQATNTTIRNCQIVDSLTVGFHIIYSDFTEMSNCAVDTSGACINFGFSDYNKVTNCSFKNAITVGMQIAYGSRNLIKNCLFQNNNRSMLIEGVSSNVADNIITRNIFESNDHGIYINSYDTSPLTTSIYHNNFLNNTIQAYDDNDNSWDNVYPSGGNYWSDYAGLDLMNGPLQNIPGSDGIGDTPYIFEFDQDNYPFTDPDGWDNMDHEFFLNLTPGWNLISLPLEQRDGSLDKALGSIAGKWDCIRTFDPLDPEPWKSNITSRPYQLNDFDTLNHKVGFWINITEPGVTLTVEGFEVDYTTIPLYAGWNLVGYPTLSTTMEVAYAFWGVPVDRVEVFDPAEPYLIKEVGPTYLMKPGEGYWVHVPADSVWVVDW